MGVWGYGNMESDYAMDTLGRWLNSMIDEIRNTFKLDNQDSLYERKGDARIMANIDIIVSLCQNYGTYPDLEVNEVGEWEKNYLATFDRIYGEATNTDEFVMMRRRTVVETFTNLRNRVIELHSDDL
jgi:hypothetical protein